MKTFSNGEILTAPLLNSTMWSFSTYKASTDGITLGSGGTITTNYLRLGQGELVLFNGYIQFGTSPAITEEIRVTLPTNANTVDYDFIEVVQWCHGAWVFRDDSVPYHYAGSLGIWNTSGTGVSFAGAWNGTAPRKRIDTGIPVTVASGDRLSWEGWYITSL